MTSTLILGGRRSGKSARAQALASTFAEVTLIATATASDGEMAERITRHQADRPAHWHTVESPLYLASALQQADAAGCCLLVDCLTLWQTNLLLAEDETLLARETDALLAILPRLQAEVILVSNEVGWSIVPESALARRFADEVGRLHQRLAAACQRVELVVAGLPLTMKNETGTR
ncbi:bifunctional adenosylcobinamide kinase/adenosylcobinamide-phosphate guanylyltransferase [Leeia oryzae]|uniref:bifunctional adenosylcobinamide kinase/adenosylcobinamide-phosphate guanylyltransferase n=1 Tax=Leeia oryzae TaxID=356662 RepID=UPI0003821DA6|nr:bifunctional adenosylcobinamide kinase/adenosylcobinamide-phosphate guanylyltransferase [Leeia oryzae]